MSILIRNARVLDPERSKGYVEPRNLFVRDSRLEFIRPPDPSNPPPDADTVIDGSGLLVVPGFVSAHSHSPENLLKATTEQLPLEPWLVHLFGSCGELSAREMHLAALLGCGEMLASGTTGVMDHLWFSPNLASDKLDAVMEAYERSGIRAAVAPLVEDEDHVVEEARRRGYSLHETPYGRRFDGAMSPDEQLSFLEDFFRRWHGKAEGRLQCGVGPAGFQWCSLDFLRRLARLARRRDGIFHIHAMETRLQALICRACFDPPVLTALAEDGLLDGRTSLAHGVWLQEGEIRILSETGASVVHNPASNLKLGSGRAPVPRLRRHGVNVAVGADGAASNDNQNMFESTKLVALLHTLDRVDPSGWLTARDAYEMATLGGGRVIGGPEGLGSLREGAPADLVLLDTDNPAFTPMNDAVKHLVYCETGSSVDTVIVDGSITVREGDVQTVAFDELLPEIRRIVRNRKRSWRTPEPPLDRSIEEMNAFRREFLDEHGGENLEVPK